RRKSEAVSWPPRSAVGFMKRKAPRSQAIGVIGLGIMGSAMASNLGKSGYAVHGYDIVPARRAALRKAGGTPHGSIAQVARAEPFMPGFSRAHHYLGAFGNGSKMKFVANLMVAIHNVSAAEGFVLGMKAGLAPETIYKVQADSAGTSRMFQVRGPMMVAGRYGEATMKNELWQ